MRTDTKTALLDVAEHAARAHGFDGFSYADLAQAVGIRKASIHYHFPTKADLSVALMQRYHTQLEQSCAEIDAQFQKAADRLGAIIKLYREALNGGDTLCLCVALITSRDSLATDVVEQVAAFRAMMRDWLENTFTLGTTDGTIRMASDPAAEARAMLAVLEGAQLSARAEGDVRLFDEAVAGLRARL